MFNATDSNRNFDFFGFQNNDYTFKTTVSFSKVFMFLYFE